MSERLIDPYDAAGFDLDGVIYRGPDGVPGAAAAIAGLRELGVKVGFVTNNARRPPDTVAAHLQRLGIPCELKDIVTSVQAEARLMARELPAGAEVLIIGSEYLFDEITRSGLAATWRRSEATAAIVMGFEPELRWKDFDEGVRAVQAGARWYATNDDHSRPTEWGIAPGIGGMIDFMKLALPDQAPVIAGKPFRPLMDETVLRLEAANLLFVGDRIDTDIEGAVRAGLDSLFVLSGSHGKRDLVVAGPESRPTWLAWDVTGLLAPPRRAAVTAGESRCRAVAAHVADGRVVVDGLTDDPEAQADALWAVLTLVWAEADAGRRVDARGALDRLALVP
jgi:HAD superfamily hydrolase (TIGR01450 family)